MCKIGRNSLLSSHEDDKLMIAGCDTIRWNFTRGLNDTRGAAFVLNVGFQQSAGSLQQISADSISKALDTPCCPS